MASRPSRRSELIRAKNPGLVVAIRPSAARSRGSADCTTGRSNSTRAGSIGSARPAESYGCRPRRVGASPTGIHSSTISSSVLGSRRLTFTSRTCGCCRSLRRRAARFSQTERVVSTRSRATSSAASTYAAPRTSTCRSLKNSSRASSGGAQVDAVTITVPSSKIPSSRHPGRLSRSRKGVGLSARHSES
jgi:hypothetical protein